MAKKKNQKVRKKSTGVASGGPAVPAVSGGEDAGPHGGAQPDVLWPGAFLPWRTALFMLGAILVLAALVFGAAFVGGFTALKVMLASLLEVTFPEQVYSSNYDIAIVLWGVGAVVLAGVIHPALGIGLVLLARPWLDGYTFPLDNIYFTWCIYLLCALWLWRLFRDRRALYTPVPVMIFAGLLLYLFVIAPYADQYSRTYPLLWLWLGYGLLLLVCVNIARNRTVAGLLVVVMLSVMGLQALYAILQFEYLLPFLRLAVQNPAVLRAYFNTDVISPEMAHRFMVNRAFGTMLYPPSLAAFLIPGIPLLLALIRPCYRSLRAAAREMGAIKESVCTTTGRFVMMSVAVACGLGSFVLIQFMAYFPKEYAYTGVRSPAWLETAPLLAISLAVAGFVGLANLYVLMRWGLWRWWLITRFLGILLLLPLLVYATWITYSRGAYLALLVALAWAGVLACVKPEQVQKATARYGFRRVGPVLAVLLLLVCIAILAAWSGVPRASWAQETAAAPTAPSPHAEVREEGISLSMGDLVDPATFRLRLGYWRVTLRIAAHNWLTGVGIGNFAIAYPRYQHIGAADVREAHNGFLQFFAEAGLIGGGLFAAFWGWFFLWGAWRVVREGDENQKALLLGLYAGMAAFVFHAFLDINFSHPSLMLFAMVHCGVFYACARPSASLSAAPDREPAQRSWRHLAGVCLIVLVLVVALGGTTRIYKQQLALNRMRFINLSPEAALNQRMRAGVFFLQELTQYGVRRDGGEESLELPRTSLELARLIVPDHAQLAEYSRFYRSDPEVRGRFVRLERDETPPHNALMAVYAPWPMRRIAVDHAMDWLAELEAQDRRFPHSPELAMHLTKWYELLSQYMRGPRSVEEHPGFLANYLRWSTELVERSPRHADMRMFHGDTLRWLALYSGAFDTDEMLARMEAQYETMMELSPITPQHRRRYAHALGEVAVYFEGRGDDERAAEYRNRSRQLHEAAGELEMERREAQLYR